MRLWSSIPLPAKPLTGGTITSGRGHSPFIYLFADYLHYKGLMRRTREEKVAKWLIKGLAKWPKCQRVPKGYQRALQVSDYTLILTPKR